MLKNKSYTGKREGGRISLLSDALKMAAAGYPVLPVSAGGDHRPPAGEPLTRGGVKDATTKADQIRCWWDAFPDAQVGVATGWRSGLLVIECESTEAWRAFGAPESTVMARTDRGAVRVFYQTSKKKRLPTCEVAPGVRMFADDGFVVVPLAAIALAPETKGSRDR